MVSFYPKISTSIDLDTNSSGAFSSQDYSIRLLSGSHDEMTPEESIEHNEEMAAELGIAIIFLLLFFG